MKNQISIFLVQNEVKSLSTGFFLLMLRERKTHFALVGVLSGVCGAGRRASRARKCGGLVAGGDFCSRPELLFSAVLFWRGASFGVSFHFALSLSRAVFSISCQVKAGRASIFHAARENGAGKTPFWLDLIFSPGEKEENIFSSLGGAGANLICSLFWG